MSIVLLVLVRVLHIVAAATLLGGAVFQRFALLPSAAALPNDAHDQLRAELRPRLAKLVMMSTGMLLVSGLSSFVMNVIGYQFDKTQSLGKLYHMLFGVKFMLALVVFFIASLLSGRSEAAQKVRANAKFWLNVNLLLALVIIVLGGLMRFADRTPKSNATRQPVHPATPVASLVTSGTSSVLRASTSVAAE